ncbi:hypothetical protein PC116_g24008 [Phytophthora cactorum]|nr:hypothetical protein PC128_g24689 [Phytophthora cactorum]KAG4039991.1 hypothetical protein PC123_g24464 [Phytophthora cactorum]KAG4227613.1 hypothetical protein PC116_g24008 [Phytophthora cactorum]
MAITIERAQVIAGSLLMRSMPGHIDASPPPWSIMRVHLGLVVVARRSLFDTTRRLHYIASHTRFSRRCSAGAKDRSLRSFAFGADVLHLSIQSDSFNSARPMSTHVRKTISQWAARYNFDFALSPNGTRTSKLSITRSGATSSGFFLRRTERAPSSAACLSV